MKPTLVSVVSPVYGCSGCLEDLVDRVEAALSAQATPFEVILVDDASPDDAWHRIAELARSRPWLAGLRLSRNSVVCTSWSPTPVWRRAVRSPTPIRSPGAG